MSSQDHLPLQPVSDKFVIPLDSHGNVRDTCCSQYFEICGGCDGKPIELKLCNYNAICLTVTSFFKWCPDKRGCVYPPNVNANVAIYTSEKICKCTDDLGWNFLIYPPEGAQALNVCAELVPYIEPPCDPCGNKIHYDDLMVQDGVAQIKPHGRETKRRQRKHRN